MTDQNDQMPDNHPGSDEHSTEGDALVESIRALRLAKGDILVVEVAENINQKQLHFFRRHLGERLEAAGHRPEDIVAIVIPKGTAEVTKLTTARLDALEHWVKDVAESTPYMEDHAALEREVVELKGRLSKLEGRLDRPQDHSIILESR